MREIIFVTGNEHKLREARQLLSGFEVKNEKLNLPEIQGTAEEIIIEKAKTAFKILNKPCFVEDVSFGFEAWKGLPGPYIKDFIKIVGLKNIPGLVDGKSKVTESISLVGLALSEDDIRIVKGVVKGKVVSYGGKEGFTFDKIFVADGETRRYSEMSSEEKNKISHRALSFKKLNALLKKLSF